MDDRQFSRSGIIAVAWWVVVAVFIGAGWLIVAFAPSAWRWAGVSIGTGCATSAIAATMHIKLFALQTCAQVQASHEVTREVDSLRQIR